MRPTFEQLQSISDDIELKAAAAAAFVLGARVDRLDIPPAQGMRDFDLVFRDDSREPLEITRYVDRAAYGLAVLEGRDVWAITSLLDRVYAADAAPVAEPHTTTRSQVEPRSAER
jgi:hypothetical protein